MREVYRCFELRSVNVVSQVSRVWDGGARNNEFRGAFFEAPCTKCLIERTMVVF